MQKNINHNLKYKIFVSGAADTAHCPDNSLIKGQEIGREIARHNAILINGATTGFPLWAAKGAKEENGFVIGVSPALNLKEHIETYNLPMGYNDTIIYTGLGYSGRNLLLARSSDAIVVGCGRIGTLNEFTDGFEDKKPIGILKDAGGTTDLIKEIIKKSKRGGETSIIYEDNPKILIEKLIKIIEKEQNAFLK